MVQLSADNLQKRFGSKTVLPGLSFSYPAMVLGIAGQNGSGKSTLLRCITGLLKPNGGRVEWHINGTVTEPRGVKPHLGYAAPYIQLYEELTVFENIRFLCDLSSKPVHADIAEHLEEYEAAKLTNQPYGRLSTGQQQRVRLAAATIRNPGILVLDEPGSNLDRPGKELVARVVNRYRSEGKMVILASNQQDELDLCDEILDLNQYN
jgi:ABC-type multidrug transport system ATPase subunit